MNFPYKAPFQYATLHNWVVLHHPKAIGLNDTQYAWLVGDGFDHQHLAYVGGLRLGLVRHVNGIPIEFLDAPKDHSTCI